MFEIPNIAISRELYYFGLCHLLFMIYPRLKPSRTSLEFISEFWYFRLVPRLLRGLSGLEYVIEYRSS